MSAAPVPGGFAVDATALTRRFGDIIAVDHVDLKIPYGEIFGLLGANGAGKTTLIKMLSTLLRPTSGHAQVGGFDIISQPAQVRGRIGYVPQLLSADGALTGADNLVRTYSGGMIRRLELAQAMLHRPAILFLDEPTIGLDPVARHSVWDRLLDLRREFGMTVLITTHDMEEAEALCNELAILHSGQVAVVGKPSELRESLGVDATMDDVFVQYAGGGIREDGNFSNTVQTRRTAQRLG
jgi:ABC-2 type transport system ATP-binding protein